MTFGKSKTEADQEPSRGGGGGDFIRYLKDDPVTMRILQEQSEWKYYWEHYDQGKQVSYPCPRSATDPIEMCQGCSSDNERTAKVSRKIAFNALTSFNGVEYVNVWKVGPMVADKLENRIKRWDTITDRDYTLSRYKGSGDRWDFDVEGGTPVAIDLHKEEWKDIEALLQQAWDDVWGEGGSVQREEEVFRPRATIAPAAQSEEPPFEPKVYQETDLRAMDYEHLVMVVKEQMGETPPSTLTTTNQVVDWLMDLQR
jgi:hypothetical protein